MRVAAAWLWFSFLLAAAGCSVLPQREPPPALHDFGPRPHHSTEQVTTAWSSVTVDAPEWLQDEQIRYRLLYADPTRMRFYTRDRWLAPPPALLAQRWSAVSDGRGYRLRIGLIDFEQVFDRAGHARAVLQFRATAEIPDSRRPVGERVFQFTRATPSADAAGAVTAFAALVDEAATSVEAWLAALPP